MISPSSSPRAALTNITNKAPTHHDQIPTPPREDDRGKKRKRSDCDTPFTGLPKDSTPPRRDILVKFPRIDAKRTGAGCSVARSLFLLQSGQHNIAIPSLSPLPVLAAYVSCNQTSQHRFHTADGSSTTFAFPYACAFSSGAKRGRNHLLAVATNEGRVELVNTSARDKWEPEPSRSSFQTHLNGVFDVRWSSSDERIVTSSGDQTAAVFDVERCSSLTDDQGPHCGRLAVLAGHSSSIKQTIWAPHNPNVLVSASRDGNIHMWDLRQDTTKSEGEVAIAMHTPVLSIWSAHGGAPATKRSKSPPLPRSVTSINFLDYDENFLLSSGSADGVLKVWDWRTASGFDSTAKNQATPLGASADLTMSSSPEGGSTNGRGRGICSVVTDISGQWAWALGRDAKIHTYPLISLCQGVEGVFPASTFSHPGLQVSSFFPRLSLSPCGSFLASGSSGGGVYLWDVNDISNVGGGRPKAVELIGHESGKEVGGLDWGTDTLASASDDLTVRVWRPDPEVQRQCQADEEGARWQYGFASSRS